MIPLPRWGVWEASIFASFRGLGIWRKLPMRKLFGCRVWEFRVFGLGLKALDFGLGLRLQGLGSKRKVSG